MANIIFWIVLFIVVFLFLDLRKPILALTQG